VHIAIKLLPKLCAQNACGIVRHSTLWVKPETIAQVEFLEWTGANHTANPGRRVALAGRRGRHRLCLDRIASDSHCHRKAELILRSGMPGAE
jgi:hypothetical protein